MTREEFREYVNRFAELLRLVAPRDTGNLAFHAIKIEWHGNDEAEIYVDGDGQDGIAPYMPFTNEPWVADRWRNKKGKLKKNPNEGWWQKAIKQIVRKLNKEFGGKTVERP